MQDKGKFTNGKGMPRSMKRTLQNISILLLYLLMAGLLMLVIYRNGNYPAGSDTMFHVYRGDVIYQSIKEGNWFPLLDPTWYNGAELLRYWAPFPAYCLALCQFFAGGNLFAGYLWFCASVFFLGACAWLRIGILRKRFALGVFLGILWFFMPNNLFALFGEGNLARSLCMVFLPFFVHYLHAYLYEENKKALFNMMLASLFMVLCHLGYAGMIFLAVVVYLVCYLILYKNGKKVIQVIIGIACSFLWTGVWTVASLQGGITSTDSSQVMKGFFQSAAISLNPFYRMKMGLETFYFGLAAFLLALMGLVLSKRKSISGFATGVLICFATTTTMYPLISRLPGSQYLWMLRFISIALVLILFSFLVWDSLKTPFVVLFCVILVLDTLPSMELVYGKRDGRAVEERMDEFTEKTLIADAKAVTTQRMAFMDKSLTGATGAYTTSAYGGMTQVTFGAGWQGANTAKNIVQLNEALEQGYYEYLFDRCLELGNDTVLIDVSLLKNAEKDLEGLEAAAKSVGYDCVSQNDGYRVYHLETYPAFGVITKYDAIAIGAANEDFTMLYPTMEVGKSTNLNDYSYEELIPYKLVFLGEFSYTYKSKAEDLIRRLSRDGVRVVISADGVPVDEKTGIQEFLGVSGYTVQFSNGYPMIVTQEETIDLDLFRGEHASWKTVYLEGLEDCWAFIEDKGKELAFYGTAENENIVFVGLNLVYHCTLTKDATGVELLSRAMTPLTTQDVPERTLVPVEITYYGNSIRIETEYDAVNTCIAYHDNFDVRDGRKVYEKNNLAYVDAGVTEIDLYFPYLWPGMIVTIAGVIMAGILLVVVYKQKKA